MSTEDSNKRIAKNTVLLYIRMFVTMAVSLYTSRVVLQTLGVEDFGIYNVVSGIVVLFAFVNNAMSIASQRFLSYALGSGDEKNVGRVFSMSMTSHIIIAVLFMIASETVGIYLLLNMNFPAGRWEAVHWAYQLALLSCFVQIVRVPYNASIIAFEKMSFYAKISIFEVIAKLLIVYILLVYKGDRLILYSLLVLAVNLLVTMIFKIYCNRKFAATKYKYFWEKKMFVKFFSFSGWSLVGSFATISVQQGVSLLLNVYCGVIVNAAVGVSSQVMTAVGQFVGNFQVAFNPQLVKTYASGKMDDFKTLILKSSKFSFFLIYIISLPLILNCDYILELWLGDVPEYASAFSQLIIIFLMFEAFSGPLWVAVQAKGEIKNYQLIMGFLIFLNLPIDYILLELDYSPVSIFQVKVFMNMVTLLGRIIYLRYSIDMDVMKFMRSVILRSLLVVVVSAPIPYYWNTHLDMNLLSFVGISVVCVVCSLFAILFIGLDKAERIYLCNFIKNKFSHDK